MLNYLMLNYILYYVKFHIIYFILYIFFYNLLDIMNYILFFIHHILYNIFIHHIIYHIFPSYILYDIYTPELSRCLFKHQPPIQQQATLGSFFIAPFFTDQHLTTRSAIRVLWQEALYRAVKHCLVTFLGQDPRSALVGPVGRVSVGVLKGGGYQPGTVTRFELVGLRWIPALYGEPQFSQFFGAKLEHQNPHISPVDVLYFFLW